MGTVVSMNIPMVVLIIIIAVLFIGAFLVSPFFFGRCFLIKKVELVSKNEVSSLLSNTKSLSKIEIEGNRVLLTRAGEENIVRLDISAKGNGKFKMNKKVVVNFGKEETAELVFNSDVESIYLAEVEGKDRKSIFLSNFYSALIIAGIQFIAVSAAIALTVFAYEGFNVPYSNLWHPNYPFAYLSCIAGLLVGGISFYLNYKRMKLSQNPLNIKLPTSTSRKGGK